MIKKSFQAATVETRGEIKEKGRCTRTKGCLLSRNQSRRGRRNWKRRIAAWRNGW